jgi:hypothetical protein
MNRSGDWHCATRILEWRPLIDSGRDQNDCAEHVASASHHGIEQGRALKRRERNREIDPADPWHEFENLHIVLLAGGCIWSDAAQSSSTSSLRFAS